MISRADLITLPRRCAVDCETSGLGVRTCGWRAFLGAGASAMAVALSVVFLLRRAKVVFLLVVAATPALALDRRSRKRRRRRRSYGAYRNVCSSVTACRKASAPPNRAAISATFPMSLNGGTFKTSGSLICVAPCSALFFQQIRQNTPGVRREPVEERLLGSFDAVSPIAAGADRGVVCEVAKHVERISFGVD